MVKDKDVINEVGQKVGVEPRMLISCMIVEQLRLFHSEREVFKKFFEPLKVLGNANKISLGIMGIKEPTAVQIEEHIEYYLGKDLENILDYDNIGADNNGDDRFKRLTDDKNNHYYSYLYGALYLRQFINQWEKAGYPIKYRPEIAGTLFNVGFSQSKPKSDPKVGGSDITVGDGSYSFGSLAYEFYYSGELMQEFPYQ